MKLIEAKKLIDKLVETHPDQEVRLILPMSDPEMEMVDEVRKLGYFTHWEGSAYARIELVVKDKCDGYIGPTRTETPPS